MAFTPIAHDRLTEAINRHTRHGLLRHQRPGPIGAPTFSIIIPSYNSGQFLERALLSILNQDFQSYELIVIDGGSTDETPDILSAYAPYIDHWVSEPDSGQSDALNKGVKLASGELLGWQNADDIYLPGALQEVNRLKEESPQAAVYSGNVLSIDQDDEVVGCSKFIRPTVDRLLYEGFIMSSQGTFWRRDNHPNGLGFRTDLHHAMDVDLWLRLLQSGAAAFTDQPLGAFRRHPGTKTSSAGHMGTEEYNALKAAHNVVPGTATSLRRMLFRSSRLLRAALKTTVRHRVS